MFGQVFLKGLVIFLGADVGDRGEPDHWLVLVSGDHLAQGDLQFDLPIGFIDPEIRRYLDLGGIRRPGWERTKGRCWGASLLFWIKSLALLILSNDWMLHFMCVCLCILYACFWGC